MSRFQSSRTTFGFHADFAGSRNTSPTTQLPCGSWDSMVSTQSSTCSSTLMEDHGLELRLQLHQMLVLANATHHVTHNLGRSLRRELLRSRSNLRDGNPRHEDGPVRVGRRSRLEATVTDLVNMPAPAAPV